MVRFAFVPNESSRKKLESLRRSGTTYAFSALFKPRSIKKADDGSHKLFENEEEILDLFSVIDGSKEDDFLLGFLDYDKIKEGKMCRHMVIVLPYCASCDALEALIKNNKEQFKNLGEYEIVNISGVDNPNRYKTAEDVKRAIAKFESEGKKTITLTVNRMLTGSTVREWDTMLFFKDTASPQEYDQAVFRLQNQYVTTYTDSNGHTIKFNMKPQTLLVDFDPNRMFAMQERKSKIYNANVETGGNTELEKRIRQELEISPIIMLNKDKIVKVVATDILEAVSNYQKDKGIKDEALEVPVDLSVLKDDTIRSVIERENEIGSKSGLSIAAHEQEDGKEDGDDIDIPDSSGSENDSDEPSTSTPVSIDEQKKKEQSLSKKIQSYYARILLFAFITKDTVISLADIIAKSTTEYNARTIKNLGLNVEVLSLLNQRTNKFVLSDLDYKIQNLNKLSNDDSLSPAEKASVAINKFGKLGDAIVVTPSNICDDMVSLIPDDTYTALSQKNGKVLDIAGTAGEYAVALYKKMRALGISEDVVKNSIYTIPKSSVCYELTRKLYEMLGLNVVNIAKEFVATDLLEVKNGNNIDYDKIKALLTQNKPFDTIKLTDTLTEGENDMIKFEAVVGNPPYQEVISSNKSNKSLSKQLFPFFIKMTIMLNSTYVALITPSRWFTGDAQDGSFIKLRDFIKSNNHIKTIKNYPIASNVFPDVFIAGGVNYYLYDKNYSGKVDFSVCTDNKIVTQIRNLFEEGLDIIVSSSENYAMIQKLRDSKFVSLTTITKGRDAFGITGKNANNISSVSAFENAYELRCAYEEIRYVSKDKITKNIDIADKWKIFISKGNGGAGTLGDGKPVAILGKPYIGKAQSVCTDSLIPIGAFDTKKEAINLQKYIKTKFVRYMVGILKVSQNVYQNVYQFVPLQDFTDKSDIDWSKSVAEIDQQLYKKYNLDDSEIAFVESMIKPME